MDNSDIQLVGGPCGQHGPYTFYKAFKYTKNGVKRIVTLSEFFFVKLWIDSDLLCIGELQLLWSDKNSDQVLASLRLYFLPENTPEGRMDHGEDEVLAISEKVVLKVEDLITWITADAEWTWGRLARYENDVKDPPKAEERKNGIGPLTDGSLDFSDVEKERNTSDCTTDHEGPLVVILSYPRYCRYRAMMRRLEGVENDYLKYKIVNALGGFTSCTKNTRVLFCKDTFDYPELEGHELLCNHLAPKLKGRPRGKRKKRSVSPGSESNESESSVYNVFSTSTEKLTSEGGRNGIRCDNSNLRRSTRSVENNESRDFLKELSRFMKKNYTPIGKIPSLGYKELDLYCFYTRVQKLGGYDAVTTNRLWKSIFDEMNGHANSTSAATVVRRHYERFLLPYERHLKGEDDKPLPISERRRLKSKTGSSASDAETSESASRSGNSTPVPQSTSSVSPTTPTTPTENKEFNIQSKSEGKPSSLRSVRVKQERQKDKQLPTSDKLNIQSNNNNNNNNVNEVDSSVKTENRVAEDSTVEENSENIKCVKTEMIESTPVPEKNVEPLTSAVAPIAQKIPPEKSPSPVEGKEDVPIIKTGDTPNGSKSPEIIEVPYKPKSPEIIDLEETEAYNTTNINQPPFLHEVKKRKLDILKEGGLEVTPVRSIAPSSSNLNIDIRPSVIQPTGAQITAKPIKNEIRPIKIENSNMPPPVPPTRLHISIPQSLNISQVKVEQSPQNKISPKPFPYNANVPPKVLQSKSIYSYSEKTIYGNPKDYMINPVQPALTPKVMGPRHSGGDILDLTVSSPQKPVVEIMKVPNIPPMQSLARSSRPSYVSKPPAPLLDGRRLGSNLEITLVGSNKTSNTQSSSKYNMPSMPPNYNYPANKYSHKRPTTDPYPNYKMPRIQENGKYPNKPLIAPTPLMPNKREIKSTMDVSLPHQPYNSRNVGLKPDTPKMSAQMPPGPNSKLYPGPSPASFPYLSHQLYDSKGIPPYLPLLDPIYYSVAMQNLYSHNALSATPPGLPFPTSEQLKYYTELMAHNSRLNFPMFPLSSDTNPSINNSYKKQ